MKILLSLIFSGLFCLVHAEDNSKLAQSYINSYKAVAIQEMHRTGIPASIKLAQGLLESDWGRSDLAKTANNHFGIKCGGKWKGGTFYKEDDDKNSRGQLIESCFRSFGSPTESYMAHSDFLSDPKKEYRYGFLFDYSSTDYKAWAKGLKKSGYATDPNYPNKLIQIIENYELYKYDQPIKTVHTEKSYASVNSSDRIPDRVSLPKTNTRDTKKKHSKIKERTSTNAEAKVDSKPTLRMPAKHVSRLSYSIDAINKCRKVTAKGGETLGELSRIVGVSVDEIIAFNEIYITKDDLLESGVNVYLEKKKRSYRGGDAFHLVKEGETMESIAQLYGIRVKSLYAKNRMPKGSKTIPGVKLSLAKSVSLSERPRFDLGNSARRHKFLFEDEAKK